MRTTTYWSLALATCLLGASLGCNSSGGASEAASGKDGKGPVKLLNVSYDPTRELYEEFNQAFKKFYEQETGQEITIEQSHGGAGKQARAVIEGLEADVVTLAIGYDIDQIAKQTDVLPKDWQSRLDNNSCPYTSTIVLLVRKGNPKQIKDWDDLIKEGVAVITPDPKSSGGARYNYLAAWGFALRKYGEDEQQAKEFVTMIYRNVPILGSGARDSTTTFVNQEQGDVLLTWENEAHLAVKEFGPDKYEIVYPSVSVLAEPPVTVVDKNAAAHHAESAAKAYLEYLYSPEGQRIVAKHHYRPTQPKYADAEDLKQFKDIDLFSVDDVFDGWDQVMAKHFNDGGQFDEIQAEIAASN